jgi:hypothetical protein
MLPWGNGQAIEFWIRARRNVQWQSQDIAKAFRRVQNFLTLA